MAQTRARTSCASGHAALRGDDAERERGRSRTSGRATPTDPDISLQLRGPHVHHGAAHTARLRHRVDGPCRIVINYTQHIQPLWDKPRQMLDPMTMAVLEDHTCSRGGCHNTVDAAAAAMVPGGQLDLQAVASDEEPLQLALVSRTLFQ